MDLLSSNCVNLILTKILQPTATQPYNVTDTIIRISSPIDLHTIRSLHRYLPSEAREDEHQRIVRRIPSPVGLRTSPSPSDAYSSSTSLLSQMRCCAMCWDTTVIIMLGIAITVAIVILLNKLSLI